MMPSVSASASLVTTSTCTLGNSRSLQCTRHGLAVPCSQPKPGNSRSLQLTRHGLAVPCSQPKPFRAVHAISNAPRLASKSVICAAALNARCAEGQTQTVTRQSSTITIAPTQGKEKSPELDDGGSGLPPRDDDGGGGGGGGGGPNWSGGFFFFGFLAFLGLLKDQESEGPYREERRR